MRTREVPYFNAVGVTAVEMIGSVLNEARRINSHVNGVFKAGVEMVVWPDDTQAELLRSYNKRALNVAALN